MKLTIVNPKGTYVDTEIDYAIIDGDNGQLGLLEDHTPIVVGINEGFVKSVKNSVEHFYMISGGIVEFKDNFLNVISQEVSDAETLDEAHTKLQQMRKKAKEENKRKLIDFTELERDLQKNIKLSRAGEIK